MNRFRRVLAARPPLAARLAFALVAFLLILAFGSPPRAQGLDPSWTQVLAWGFMHHAQWGRDLVFTYGPLGFLQPYAAYVQGIFPLFATGEIALPLGFAFAIALLFRLGSIAALGVFALIYVCWCSRLGGDVSWELTMLFGVSCLIGGREPPPARVFWAVLVPLAVVDGAIALAKFSLFPLWMLCVAAIAGACALAGQRRRALGSAGVFAIVLAAIWVACGQHLANLPLFVLRGFQVAAGYPHAMGNAAPGVEDGTALGFCCAVIGLCAYAAWSARRDGVALIGIALAAAVTVFSWLAFLTRGDHWPWFYPAISLLVFALVCNERIDRVRFLRAALIAVAVAATVKSADIVGPRTIAHEFPVRLRNSVYNLTHLDALQRRRNTEWRALVNSAALPRMRTLVGNASIDVVTWEQGAIIVNGMNYAPRPVFQSYSAYTPALARLNEAHFLGPDAPRYVALRLDFIDQRLPMSEDALTLIAMLRNYRPVLVEKRFLLLRRDPAVKASAAIAPPPAFAAANFGERLPIGAPVPALAFVHVDLNAFGRLYTLLFREPALQIVLTMKSGEEQRFRLVRATAASGFVIAPALQNIGDWIKLYLSRPLAEVSALRIEPEIAADGLLFDTRYRIAFSPLAGVLHASGDEASDLGTALLYPGFNLAPATSEELRVVAEGDQDVVFLHAPHVLPFRPPAGRYAITAVAGVLKGAYDDAGCARAHADGVGLSLVLLHGSDEALLWHGEVDPFHDPAARSPKKIAVDNIDIAAGDEIDYRVDPGHGGNNISCDWSYVRDLTFTRRLGTSAEVGKAYPGFNVAPTEERLRIVEDDGKPAVFLHAPSSLTFQPALGRYRVSGTFGVQSVAVRDAGCNAAGADGVGVSIVLHHAGAESLLWRRDIDPFHVAGDRGPHTFRVKELSVAPADTVEYRVDPGHGGTNASCDWSYVRDLKFDALTDPAGAPARAGHR